MIKPEKIYLVDLGDEITWCQEIDIRDGIEGVPYIRQDVFNPDWDQAEAARESLREHMLIAGKMKTALLAFKKQYPNSPWIHRQVDEALDF